MFVLVLDDQENNKFQVQVCFKPRKTMALVKPVYMQFFFFRFCEKERRLGNLECDMYCFQEFLTPRTPSSPFGIFRQETLVDKWCCQKNKETGLREIVRLADRFKLSKKRESGHAWFPF